jgi:hypothetical protein
VGLDVPLCVGEGVPVTVDGDGLDDGLGDALGDGEGTGVVATGLPVRSSRVWFFQRYSRMVSPELCTFAATSRPRYR